MLTLSASIADVVMQKSEREVLTGNIYLLDSSVCLSLTDFYFLEEERGQKRKRELDEEGEEDEDD